MTPLPSPRVALALAFMLAPVPAALAGTQPFVVLSDRPGIAWDTDADGSTVVGWQSEPQASSYSAFRWDQESGRATLLPAFSSAQGVSADGSRVVGFGRGTFNLEFGWRTIAGGVVEQLPYPILTAPTQSAIVGISSDGQVCVGNRQFANGNPTRQAVRWRGQAIELLGTVNGMGGASYAYAANADGSVVVGSGVTVGSQRRAFRWTAGTGMVGLGVLPGQGGPDEFVNSFAQSVSADGNVVVGISGSRAFRWTAATGMADIGTLPGATITEAYDVSADGLVTIGRSIGGPTLSGPNSFVHRAGEGMRNLADVLAEKGASMSSWRLTAYAISGDGSKVVGEALSLANNQYYPFIADISIVRPCPSDLDGSGSIDGVDIGVLLAEFGACTGCVSDLDGSGNVDGVDLGRLLASWGSCAP